jgi:hypothetical protein
MNTGIRNVDQIGTRQFILGEALFIITIGDATLPPTQKNCYCVATSRDDYLHRLHYISNCKLTYSPLIFLAPIHYRIAYVFGCLNKEYGVPRDTFTFWWRKKGIPDKPENITWNRWFVVYPFNEKDMAY